MILLIINLLQKFDYKIDETNIKKFLKALQKLKEYQHQIFLEDLEKTFQFFDEQKKVIDNINPFKHLITLSKQLSDIRFQKDYLLQCEKNNALIEKLLWNWNY